MSRLFTIQDEKTHGKEYFEIVLETKDETISVPYEGRTAVLRGRGDFRFAKEEFYTYGDKECADLLKHYKQHNNYMKMRS